MFRLVSKLFGTRTASRPLTRRLRHAPRVEALEERSVPAVLFVDPVGFGPIKPAFPTITAAVDAAHPGDIIKVVPGTYKERVDINKAGVTLLGGQVRIPLIEHAGPSIITADSPTTGFTLDANNITIQGFTFAQEGEAIRTLSTFAGYRILSNKFLDNGVGVHLNTLLTATSPATVISGSTFTNDGTGVPIKDDVLIDNQGARNVVIRGNTFTHGAESDASINVGASNISTNIQVLGNTFISDGGIDLAGAQQAKVDGNVIVNPLTTAVLLDGGVSSSEVANNTITVTQTPAAPGIVLGNEVFSTFDTGNRIAGNNIRGTSVGILLSPASQTTVAGNTVAFTTGDGIVLQAGGTANTLTGNTVAGAAGNGIRVTGVDGNTLKGNTLLHNHDDGITLASASGTMLTGNVAEVNGLPGISVAGGSHDTLTSNTTSFNPIGMLFDGTDTDCTLSKNLAEHNVEFGFELGSQAQSNTLSQNTARANLQEGFLSFGNSNTFDHNIAVNNLLEGFLIENAHNTITSNTAVGNGLHGFNVFDGDHNLIKANVANDNEFNGFQIQQDTGDTITGNTADRNAGDGILLIGTTGAALSGNTAQNNLGDGIDVSNASTGNTITGNTATGNGLANGGFDLFDISGTNTQNTWSQNKANTRNPGGLG